MEKAKLLQRKDKGGTGRTTCAFCMMNRIPKSTKLPNKTKAKHIRR